MPGERFFTAEVWAHLILRFLTALWTEACVFFKYDTLCKVIALWAVVGASLSRLLLLLFALLFAFF